VFVPSSQTNVVGIIVPDQEMLIPWAKSQGIEGTFSQLCKNEVTPNPSSLDTNIMCLPFLLQRVKKAIMDEISKLGKEAKLFGFEQVCRYAVLNSYYYNF